LAGRDQSKAPARKRADMLLVERGLFDSRSRAQAARWRLDCASASIGTSAAWRRDSPKPSACS